MCAAAANTLLGALLFCGAVVVLASLGTRASTSTALLGLIACTVLLAASNCLEAFYRAERRLRIVVVAAVLEKFLLLTCIVAVAVLDYGLWSVGVAYIVADWGDWLSSPICSSTGLAADFPHQRCQISAGSPKQVSRSHSGRLPERDSATGHPPCRSLLDDSRGILCAW
jgi:hypothetical protein